MREPIEPKDIRKGDLIRVEFVPRDERLYPGRALEYRAQFDKTAMSKRLNKWGAEQRRYYLLDRPTSPVDLPEKNTLGFLTVGGQTHVGVWRKTEGYGLEGAITDLNYTSDCWNEDEVTAFTPAVAVPAEALERLRSDLMPAGHRVSQCAQNRNAIRDFLAAVDEANSTERGERP